jgi:aminopeptidase N
MIVRPLILAVLVAAHAVPAAAEAPFKFDTTPGRLPKNVVPTDYRIALVPDVTAKTLRGNENVALDVRRPTARIVFNTHDIVVSEARFDGTRVAKIATDNEKQLTTLTLARPAPAGHHVLTLAYTGKIEDSPDGLFAQDYTKADGSTARMLSTQFESTDARRAFPSWDEPAFRASYQLTVTLPAAWSAVSNMPVESRAVHGDLATTTFGRTPKMSSYLVVLSAGDFDSISGTGPDGVKQTVWAPRGSAEDGRYTLESAEKLLAYYDDYFGVKYPLPKLDHIAVPGGFNGAMENWGGITYNEGIIIHRPNASLRSKQGGFSIVAHEMAHQWNGDLVTMAWWDDIWLNESFASWMAAKATDKFNPDWLWWQAEDVSKESAMQADARVTATPLQKHVVDELQAEASFDPEITYNKGEAFLRMLEAYLGETTFRDGVRAYMQAHKYSNATTADLWNALGATSKKDVAALAKGWTEQPGFPLISVSTSCDAAGNRTVTLAQKRFLLDGGTDATTAWHVPVALASGSGAPAYVLLAEPQQSGIPAGRCGEPLRANAGNVGYYRVAYDAATLEANRAGFAALGDDDKLRMLDDQWALVESGAAPLPSYFALSNAIGNDRNPHLWRQIVGSLSVLENATRNTPQHDPFVAQARATLAPLAASLGWDSKPNEAAAESELRRTVIFVLGSWGDPATLAQARTRFDRALLDPSSTTPDMLSLVAGIVATNADAETFDKLHELAKTAKDRGSAARYRFALMRVRDPKLAARALDIALSGEVPPQQDSSRLAMVATVAAWNPKLAWTFFEAHSDQLTRKFSQFEKILSLTDTVPAVFSDAAPPDQIEAWLKANLPAQATSYIDKGLTRARADAAVRARLREDVRGFLAAGGRKP